jgi:glucose/arabinose dehydrogenase
MRRTGLLAVTAALTMALATAPAWMGPSAATVPAPAVGGTAVPSVSIVRVVGGLNTPTDIASPPGSSDLFIAQKCGVIRVYAAGALHRAGSLKSRTACDGERGLLSLAFHPDFATNHLLFVLYNRKSTGDVQVARVRVKNRRIVTGSFRKILRIGHRQAANHNGGKLVFSGGGLLHISIGDGGGGGNQFGHAQDRGSLLGKILRIDVDHGSPYSIPKGNPLRGKKGRPEIWAIGLRNPWRMALDPATHSLWIGDVGQDLVEEVDRVRVGDGRLRNFGWSRFEGNRIYDANERLRGGRLVRPVYTYRHPEGISIIGGAVYRGADSPALRGYYVYGDLHGWIAGFDISDTGSSFKIDPGGTLLTISKATGNELYAGYADGTIYRIAVA